MTPTPRQQESQDKTPIITSGTAHIEINDLLWVYLTQNKTRIDNTFNKVLIKELNLKVKEDKLVKIESDLKGGKK